MKRIVGFALIIMALITSQILIGGCSYKVVKRAYITHISLQSEWNQVKKEAGRNIVDAGLIEIQLETYDDGRVILNSWQWVEPVNGINTVYFAVKNAEKYKITSSANTLSLSQQPIPIDTVVATVDRYGLDKIFREKTSANLVLREAKEPTFSVINCSHVLIRGGVEIEQSKISQEKHYIEGLYGAQNRSRQYMFSIE